MGEHKSNPHAFNNTAPAPPQLVRDLYGRPLEVGDRILVTGGNAPMYTVVDVRPVLDPRLPPNTVVVTLQSTIQFPAGANGRLQNVVRVMTATEAGLVPNVTADKPAETPAGDTTDGSAAPEKAPQRVVE